MIAAAEPASAVMSPSCEAGQGRERQPAGDRADQRHVPALEPEDQHGHGRADDRQQRARGERLEPVQDQQEHDDDSAQRQRHRPDLAEPPDQLRHLVRRRVRRERDPGDGAQLGPDHDQRHACHVPERGSAGRGGRRGTPGAAAHAPMHRTPTMIASPADRASVARGVPGCQRRDRGRHHDRRGGLRAHRQLPGGAQERVQDHRDDRDPQPGHGRRAGEARVGEALRHEIGRDGDAGQHVDAEPRALVAAELRGAGHHAVRGASLPAAILTAPSPRVRSRPVNVGTFGSPLGAPMMRWYGYARHAARWYEQTNRLLHTGRPPIRQTH